MSEEEHLDVIEGTDEDGNEVLLVVEKYFFYNGDEYVLLRPRDEEVPVDKATRYVMRVNVTEEDGEEYEEFEPVAEDLAQRLIPVIREQWQHGE